MDKKKKTESQPSKHHGAVTRNESQEQKGRPSTERRQNEIPRRNDEQQHPQASAEHAERSRQFDRPAHSTLDLDAL